MISKDASLIVMITLQLNLILSAQICWPLTSNLLIKKTKISNPGKHRFLLWKWNHQVF